MASRLAVYTIAIVAVTTLRGAAGLGLLDVMPQASLGTAFKWGMATFKQTGTGKAVVQKLAVAKEMPDKLYNYAQELSNSAIASANAAAGYSDGPGVVKLIEPKMESWFVPKTNCLSGAKFTFDGKDVTLSNGRVTISKDDIKIVGYEEDEEEESATSKTLFIAFRLPSIKINYAFTCKPTSILERNREGRLQLRLQGPDSLVLRVRVDSQMDDVKRQQGENTCFIRIREIDFELAEEIEVAEMFYDSLYQNNLNYGFTQQAFQKLAKNAHIRDGLKEIIKRTLKKAFEKIIKDKSVFCDPKDITTAESPNCSAETDLDVKRENVKNE